MTDGATPPEEAAAARALLEDVFRHYGWAAEGAGPHLRVAAPPPAPDPSPEAPEAPGTLEARARRRDGDELGRRFGRGAILFAFDAKDAAHGVDLVAPGGHVLRTLEEFFAGRGRRTYVAQKGELRLTKATLAPALGPARGHDLSIEAREDEEAHTAHFGFRLLFRGREHKDSLVWVEVTIRGGEAVRSRIVEPPSAESLASGVFHPRKHVPAAALAKAFQTALGALDREASREASELEARIRQRLEKDASRLELFYSTAILEHQRSRAPIEVSELRIAELEEERTLKRRELLEGARVTVEVEPLQLLAVERPLKRALVQITRKPKRSDPDAAVPGASFDVRVDLVSGEVDAPPCPGCREPLRDVAVDDQGHAIHASCVRVCSGCERIACTACGVSTCARGPDFACEACALACESCGETTCPVHRAPCGRCQTVRCDACLHRCAHCHELVCEKDRLAIGDGAEAWLCTTCGVACAGCARAVLASELGRCATCGRLFCASCLGGKRAARQGSARCTTCRAG